MDEIFKLFGSIGVDTKPAQDGIDEVTNKAKESSTKMPELFKKAAKLIGTAFVLDKVIDFGKVSVEAAASAQAMKAQFSQVFGDTQADAQDTVNTMARDFGMLPNRLKSAFTTTTSMFKGLGLSTAESMDQAKVAVSAAADAAAFYDKSYEDANASLSSFIKGNYEGGEAIGLFANETQIATWASNNLGVEWSKLGEADKQMARLQFATAMQKAAGATGQAARESNSYENQLGNVKQAWTDFQAIVGGPVLSVVIPALKTISGGIQSMGAWTQNAMDTAIPKLQELGAYASENLAPIMDDAARVAGKLRDGFEWVSEKAGELWTTLANGQSPMELAKGAIDGIADGYQSVRDFVKEAVDKMREAKDWVDQNKTAMELLGVAIGTVTLAIGAYNVAQAIKNLGGIGEIIQLGILQVQIWGLTAAQAAQTIATGLATTATAAFGAVMAFVTSPITLVVLAIGALIAVGILLYKNWGTIKAKATEIFNGIKTTIGNAIQAAKDKVTSIIDGMKTAVSDKINAIKTTVTGVFDGIKNAIGDKINAAKDTVKTAIDKILGFFNFKWELPKLKMPHFNITGGFSLVPPKVPKFDIEWYKDGGFAEGIMTQPTLMGLNGTRAMVGGEAGDEAILPLNREKLGGIGAGIVAATGMDVVNLGDKLDQLIALMQQLIHITPTKWTVTMDGRVVAGQITPFVSQMMAKQADKTKRGG